MFGRWFNTCTALAGGGTRGCIGSKTSVRNVRQSFQLQTWVNYLTSVRKSGYKNVDMSLQKGTQFTHWVNVIFRADFISTFNSPEFYSGPITDVKNGNFGRIAGAVSQSNLPRFVQFSLKVEF